MAEGHYPSYPRIRNSWSSFIITICAQNLDFHRLVFKVWSGQLAEWSLSQGGPASVPPSAVRKYFRTVPRVRDDSSPPPHWLPARWPLTWGQTGKARTSQPHLSVPRRPYHPASKGCWFAWPNGWSLILGGPASAPPSATREYFRTVPGLETTPPPPHCCLLPGHSHGPNWQDENSSDPSPIVIMICCLCRFGSLGCTILQVLCIDGVRLSSLDEAGYLFPPVMVRSIICFILEPWAFHQSWLQ